MSLDPVLSIEEAAAKEYSKLGKIKGLTGEALMRFIDKGLKIVREGKENLEEYKQQIRNERASV